MTLFSPPLSPTPTTHLTSTDMSFSPIHGNAFRTRADVVQAVHSIFDPLLPAFSPGCARVQLDASEAHFDRAACDLEGFARPLWGLAPLTAGGFAQWETYRRGLAHGTDPDHAEYWGQVGTHDQRQVELAALGFALLLVPEEIWDPLNDRAKKHVAEFLIHGRNEGFPECNWKFFRVMVDLGLQRVGVRGPDNLTESYLCDIERYYVADGWYRDGDEPGNTRRIEYYNPFAMHFYGLIYAKMSKGDHARSLRLRQRAREFALQFQHWFADDGACIPYGRSLTYRFACGSFWGALAFADEECMPWGVIKGMYLRHLRWWSQWPVSRGNDGRLSVGYAYPNQHMCEPYNSSGSPYWAMKMFAPLALPATHPFWMADELPMEKLPSPMPLPVPGMVMLHYPNNTVALVSGPEQTSPMRYTPEKYLKFAYSTRYAFSVESELRSIQHAVVDSMIAFSEEADGPFRVREHLLEARIADNVLYSKWAPWKDVHIETWLIPHGLWHLRIHRIQSARELVSVEGGFAVPRADFNADTCSSEGTWAWVESKQDCSGIRDLSDTPRAAKVAKAEPHTNLMFPRTWVPQLVGTISAHQTTVLACAVLASPDRAAAQEAWTDIPQLRPMEEWTELASRAAPVGIFN